MRLHNCLKKFCILTCFAVVFLILFFANTLIAQAAVLNRTGTIKITQTDGKVLTIREDEPLPMILSGSTVEIVSGSAEISPAEGFIQVVVGDSVASVKAGSIITTAIDVKTNEAEFEVQFGKINVITGNTTVTVNSGQKVKLKLNKTNGIVEVKSIRGSIETVTARVKASVSEDAIAQISVEPISRMVHVVSVKGDVEVISLEKEILFVSLNKPVDIQGSFEGEVQTFGEIETVFIPEEEPVEPERPEASPHRP